MKTSIDLPDTLYRRVKARSALEGRAVREVATELLTKWVNSSPTPTPSPEVPSNVPKASGAWKYEWAALGARVEEAIARPSTTATKKSRSTKGKQQAPLGLVEQLKRDRR